MLVLASAADLIWADSDHLAADTFDSPDDEPWSSKTIQMERASPVDDHIQVQHDELASKLPDSTFVVKDLPDKVEERLISTIMSARQSDLDGQLTENDETPRIGREIEHSTLVSCVEDKTADRERTFGSDDTDDEPADVARQAAYFERALSGVVEITPNLAELRSRVVEIEGDERYDAADDVEDAEDPLEEMSVEDDDHFFLEELGADDEFGSFAGIEADHHDQDIDIPDYDADARQSPWEQAEDDDGPVLWKARLKAATITGLLEIVSVRQRETSLAYLTELFSEFRHSSTYRAIERIAAGLDFELLQAMAELKRYWTERDEWWAGRYGFGAAPGRMTNGASALSWRLAHRVCLARSDEQPQTMIEESWFEEWLNLSRGDEGFLSFVDYVGVKCRGYEAEKLYAGLLLEHQDNREWESRWSRMF
ncbi:hypothetical protein [Emcibacter sp. SYSU 3D8]|uniref:hypothetical protein n=1 Tax=Emcibacter sp. SYSU 3D8 TaxID=3133969 RepID=UPI0031FF14F9